jgi:hypothetical protein
MTSEEVSQSMGCLQLRVWRRLFEAGLEDRLSTTSGDPQPLHSRALRAIAYKMPASFCAVACTPYKQSKAVRPACSTVCWPRYRPSHVCFWGEHKAKQHRSVQQCLYIRFLE